MRGEAEIAAFDKFSELAIGFLRERMRAVTSGLILTSSKRTKLWSDLHKIRLEPTILQAAWKELLVALNLPGENGTFTLIQQSVYSELFSLLLCEQFPDSHSTQHELSCQNTVFSEDELNALRYACGYVPRMLLKKYEIRPGKTHSEYVQCLGDMAVEGDGDNILSYTRKWLDIVNRGGLFPLNDKSFLFFVAIEKIVRSLLPSHAVCNDCDKQTFQRSVLDKIASSDVVQFYWRLLSRDIQEPRDSDTLLMEIVTQWVTVRGYSLAAAWMEEYKRSKQKTTQKTPGLRKSIY